MSIIIKKSDLDEVDKICELLQICYDYPVSSLERFKEKFDKIKDEYYSILEDKIHIGNVRAIQFKQNIRGVLKPMVGFANFTSAPEKRRKGYVRLLIREIFKDMNDQGVVCSTLYPFKDEFYAKFNYINANPIPSLEFNPNLLKKWKNLPEGYRIERIKPNLAKEIYTKLQEEAILSIHGGVIRNQNRWDAIFSLNRGYLIVAYNPKNIPEAIMICNNIGFGDRLFGEDNIGTINVSDMYWFTADARSTLFNYLYLNSDQIIRVNMQINPNESHYSSWITGFTKVKMNLNMVTMFRIINVEKCLQDLPLSRSGEIQIQVEDPDCKWNEKVYSLKEVEGKLKISSMDSTPTTCKIQLTIKGLSALIYGTLPIEEIQYFRWISGANSEELKLFQDWFPRKDPFMIEPF
ncbi:MAG: GNAT family N-acetyltransferase [Promethearchaeota archaeon]